jgi:AcrR family transcriptional regulator
MDRRGKDAHDKIVDAARDLFAERGIEGASLREITRAAGQANTSALQYHFGDRESLLDAVLAPHQVEVDARRDSLLEEFETRETPDPRDLASVLVRPSAAMLQVEGGKAYLRIMAELIRDPEKFGRDRFGLRGSLGRWGLAAKRRMPAAASPLHRRFAAMQLCFSELARRASTRRRSDHRLFVSDLIDLTSALLMAPVSKETERLLRERDSKRERSSSGTERRR